ncbi:hypothetical protein ACTWPT_06455 [Nonomuraea sp. 3N208]|uniref:hypothetical protein n=1 Tax=Nonomuraea sp. 3N208 TaxID=3457421 RepID=UPI003FCD9D46
MAASGGYGVDVVLDFAGTDSTLDLSARSLRADGELVVVGSGGGRLSVRKTGPASPGRRFPLSAAREALARLRAGQLKG